jgi:hypothetical protein
MGLVGRGVTIQMRTALLELKYVSARRQKLVSYEGSGWRHGSWCRFTGAVETG